MYPTIQVSEEQRAGLIAILLRIGDGYALGDAAHDAAALGFEFAVAFHSEPSPGDTLVVLGNQPRVAAGIEPRPQVRKALQVDMSHADGSPRYHFDLYQSSAESVARGRAPFSLFEGWTGAVCVVDIWLE